jgi:hypothetical protein
MDRGRTRSLWERIRQCGILRSTGYHEAEGPTQSKIVSVLQSYRAPHIPVVSDRYGLYLFQQEKEIQFAAVPDPITNFAYAAFLESGNAVDVDAGVSGTMRIACRHTAMSNHARLQWRLSRSHGDGDETGYSGSWKGLSMSTTVLAYLILFMGFITFLAGAFGALMLLFEEVAKTGRVPFRYYAMMVGLISGGLGMIGIGQGLRLLLLILGKD